MHFLYDLLLMGLGRDSVGFLIYLFVCVAVLECLVMCKSSGWVSHCDVQIRFRVSLSHLTQLFGGGWSLLMSHLSTSLINSCYF